MRVETLGDGTPEIAVIGGIHGDEPCGVHAVETLLAERPSLDRAVKFIVANEEAIERDQRYVEEDLNRAFPGDADGATHESRLAYWLGREIAGTDVLALHSTQSYDRTFALVHEVGPFERSVCPHLTVDAVVETCEHTEGRIFAVANRTVEVECGYQKSDEAAANAVRVTREFLAAVGALPGVDAPSYDSLPVFRLGDPIPKARATNYEVFVDNFELVRSGETFACADDEGYVAEESFYPVLLSPYGYEDVFGYEAEKVGTLEA